MSYITLSHEKLKGIKISTQIKTICSDLVFSVCFWWIFLVSMMDHYLTIKLQEVILDTERNPLGLWLIHLDGGSVALFMTFKMSFLWLIYFIVLFLYKVKRTWAIIILLSLSFFQLLLVFYLFSDP